MNGTDPIKNVTATAPRSYFRTAIRRLIAGGAIAIAAVAPAAGQSPTASPTPAANQSSAASETPSAAKATTAKKTLWVANGANVLEFATPGGVHDEKPKAILGSAAFVSTQGVVFDASGNLWVIDGGNTSAMGTTPPSIDEFTVAQLKNLKKVPTPTPNVQITSTSLVFPQQAVFDAAGNMWVSDDLANAVFVITQHQLATGGPTVFGTTVRSTPPFSGALGIVLHGGNLYVANNGANTIFVFNASHVPNVGSGLSVLAPDVVLSDDGHGSIAGPWALIFDAAGNLWSSNANSPFTLVEFSATQITTTGSPTPAITISPFLVKVSKTVSDESLASPNGISFDDKANLGAASSATPFGLAVYDKKQEATGGSLKPKSFIVGGKTLLTAPAGDNFGPDINR